ncbi:nuclear protein localization protein 4-like protein [Pseudohyphozyma bogoriensis]|nr:nuclear protein localization protein 4-like protein [Pseudohyphozyma bogoriensis]
MLVRIRSRDGNFRFDLNPTDDISVLIQKILETSNTIDPATLALSNAPRGGENLVSGITGDLQSLGIGHGDLLFASYTALSEPAAAPTPPPAPALVTKSATLSGKPVTPEPAPPVEVAVTIPQRGGHRPWEEVEEDAVDTYWEKKDGKIPRKKGQHGCRCGPKSMCDNCTPLEPFDANYQAEHAIKHLSFHSHLKKLHSSAPLSSQSTSYVPPLSDDSYQVQVPCSSGSHPSWPAGICTKCQPSAITLSRQTYRMVDHVEFARPEIIEGLLAFWRSTGTQRFGYMLGKYEPYEEVPMGIKAVVEAIHEPPQEPHADGVTVGFPWEEQKKVEDLAKACGLQVVGMIFTDLTADDSPEAKKMGKVVAKRHANSFFLSSLEVIFSATLQRMHPNPSKFSSTGSFSSKFVTCVLSGDLDGGIAVEAYQVSDQAMAMVEADMIEASVDPGVLRVKEETKTRYIPDVFYRYKNKYNIEVKESAKPCFPVEYLLVNVTHGFPKAPNPLFVSPTPFVAENRTGFQDQTPGLVASKFSQTVKNVSPSAFGTGGFVVPDEKGKGKASDSAGVVADWLSDWHLLMYLSTMGIVEPADMKLMAQVGTTRDPALLNKLFESPSWQTFLVMAESEAPAAPARDYPGAGESAPERFDDGFEIPPDVDVPPDFGGGGGGGGDVEMGDDAGGGGGGGANANGMIACPHCTFENNPGATDCDVCGLPLSG